MSYYESDSARIDDALEKVENTCRLVRSVLAEHEQTQECTCGMYDDMAAAETAMSSAVNELECLHVELGSGEPAKATA